MIQNENGCEHTPQKYFKTIIVLHNKNISSRYYKKLL